MPHKTDKKRPMALGKWAFTSFCQSHMVRKSNFPILLLLFGINLIIIITRMKKNTVQ